MKKISAPILDKVKSSGLNAKDAEVMQLQLTKPNELAAMGFPDKQAMAVPYFTPTGALLGFNRYRYLEDTRNAFELQTTKKPLRYVQAPNSNSEVYLPPFLDWKAIQKNPEAVIAITEGELKAACCTRHVLPCIGLGGVYSFKSTKNMKPLLPIFKEFNWKQRRVIVAYDSDARTNPMVVRARNELCTALVDLGAIPAIAAIPEDEDGSKNGLDDYFVKYGEQALQDIFEHAVPYEAALALHLLNTEVAYIENPGLVIKMADGQKMRASDFVNHAYSNRKFVEHILDPKGLPKAVERKAAQAWLEWPERLALKAMTYQPGEALITDANEYNTWPGWGYEPKQGNIAPWQQLLDHFFNGYPEERQWFERWCAFPIQHPGTKMYTAAVLWGVHTGTGKSLLGYSLGAVYGKNFTEIGDTQLQDDRNEWAVDKQFVMGDDVTGHDQRKYADRLKKMITQHEMRIDQKYVPSYTTLDRINYLFTSNHPDAFFLEDDDRRFFIHEVAVERLSMAFYSKYDAWLRSDGPSHLFDHLRRLDLGDMRPEGRAPDTTARRAMVSDSLSDLGLWVRQLKDEPESILRIGDVKLPGDLWSSNDLLRLYDPQERKRVTSNTVTRELKRAGFSLAYKGMPVKMPHGQTKLFAVRGDVDFWVHRAKMGDLATHYTKTRGT